MKRKIGFTALAVAVLAFLSFVTSSVRHGDYGTMVFFALFYFAAIITAIVCLAGDVIRFIGKCFSQGFSAGNPQECGQVCPLCGKAISGNARFCSECGCELTKKA